MKTNTSRQSLLVTKCNTSCFDRVSGQGLGDYGTCEITAYSIDRVTFRLQGCLSSTCMGLGDVVAFTTRGMDEEGKKR